MTVFGRGTRTWILERSPGRSSSDPTPSQPVLEYPNQRCYHVTGQQLVGMCVVCVCVTVCVCVVLPSRLLPTSYTKLQYLNLQRI